MASLPPATRPRRVINVLTLKNEVDRPHQAQARPQVIPRQGFLHIEHREGHKDGQGHDFLKNLELAKTQGLLADPVGGHLDQVLE